MHYVMHKAITFGTCTCTEVPPLVLDPSPGDNLPDTTMLLKSCNYEMMKPPRGKCLWGIPSSVLTMRQQC